MIQITAVLLMLIGIYGLLTQKNVIKIIVALNVLEVGLNLFIVSIGYVKDGIAPILTKDYPTSAALFMDPLPHSLVLTAIVIGVGTTALGLAFARKIYQEYGTFELGEVEVRK